MEQDSPTQKYLFSGGMMILILLSLFGNVLVCLAVYYSRNLRARVNYLIVSLAIADIIIATAAMPLWMLFEITHFRNMSHEATYRVIKIWTFIDILGGIGSIANLVAISFERFWSVVSPLKHRRYMTNYTLAGVIFGVWVYATFVAATSIAWFGWEYVYVYTATVGFFFPLFLIIVAYFSIFIVVNLSPRNVISSHDNFKINLTIIIIVGFFVICWAPHFTASILAHHCKDCSLWFQSNLWIRSVTKWLHYFNSCVNPLVYGIANAQYKEAFKIVFKKMCFYRSQEEPTISTPIYYPHHKISTASKALCIELTPEDKCSEGAAGGFDRLKETNDMYLPGDYRALPVFPSPRTPRTTRTPRSPRTPRTPRTVRSSPAVRWDPDISTTETLLSTSVEDEPSAMRHALLNSDALTRTSYI